MRVPLRSSSVRHALYLVTLVTVLVFAVGEAHSCSCKEVPSPKEALLEADAVFVGVVGEAPNPSPRGAPRREPGEVARLEVLGAWKGVSSPEVLVRTHGGPGDCGYHFVLGDVYLVYAYRLAPGDSLRTSMCTRTVPLARASQDLAALPRPTFVRVDPGQWADRGVPEPCPVHPSFQVRHRDAWILTAPRTWDADAYDAAQPGFPHAALDVIPLPDPQVPGPPQYLLYALVCAACREDAIAWSLEHGAVCLDIPSSGGAVIAPDGDTAEYRRRYPDRNFAFLFDDGRRYRIDTIDGWMMRSYGTVRDTMIAFVLPETTRHRLYELAIEGRLFDLPDPHPAYLDAGRSDRLECVRMQLSIRSDSLVRHYEWNPFHAPRVPARIGPWARLHAFSDAILRAIEAHPGVHALPALPIR